jgi:hypothetical protein
MSVIFNRTVSIRRQVPQLTVGALPFGGNAPVLETVIISNVPCSIQFDRIGQSNPANLPTDTKNAMWLIIFAPSTVNTTGVLGTVTENDIVVDDLGKRYRVTSPDWQALGYTLHVMLENV